MQYDLVIYTVCSTVPLNVVQSRSCSYAQFIATRMYVYISFVLICLLALTFACNSTYLLKCSFQKYEKSIDVVVEAVDTTPSVPSFKQHTWPFLLSTHRLFYHLFGQKY